MWACFHKLCGGQLQSYMRQKWRSGGAFLEGGDWGCASPVCYDKLAACHWGQVHVQGAAESSCSAWGAQGTGTADEMALEERTVVATEGCVIADVAIVRPPAPQGAPATNPRASTSGQVRGCWPSSVVPVSSLQEQGCGCWHSG